MAKKELKIGDNAPAFRMPTDGGGEVSLASLAGRIIVLYFYPKDDTSGCTKEACEFRDQMPDLGTVDAAVVGVSRDSVASHDKFKKRHNLPFVLASDADGKASGAYGTWIEKSMYGRKYMGMERATFLIDRQCVIRAIWRQVKAPGHAAKVVAAAGSL
jgi:peroxiredoxin Q/BCP